MSGDRLGIEGKIAAVTSAIYDRRSRFGNVAVNARVSAVAPWIDYVVDGTLSLGDRLEPPPPKGLLPKLPVRAIANVSASVDGQDFMLGEDFIAEPTPGQASGRIVYVGHGHMIRAKGIDAYRGVDVKGKIMLAVEGYPRGVSFQDIQGKKAGEDYDTPETYARAHGARGVIYIPSQSTLTFWQNRHHVSLSSSRVRLEKP